MSDGAPSLAQIRCMERLDIRWRILLMAHRGRGLGVNEAVILGGLRGMGYQLTANEVRNELEYLAGLKLMHIQQANLWLASITPAGVDVAEYTTPAPPGIGRPPQW